MILSALLLGLTPTVFLQEPGETELEAAQRKVAELEAERPNIIFFLSDDQRWDRMGCAGHPFLKTPTMDRLATNGVRKVLKDAVLRVHPAERNGRHGAYVRSQDA